MLFISQTRSRVKNKSQRVRTSLPLSITKCHPKSHSSLCPTLDFFLLLLRQLLENFLHVSIELKVGGLKSCVSAEFHKIIDHISTV